MNCPGIGSVHLGRPAPSLRFRPFARLSRPAMVSCYRRYPLNSDSRFLDTPHRIGQSDRIVWTPSPARRIYGFIAFLFPEW